MIEYTKEQIEEMKQMALDDERADALRERQDEAFEGFLSSFDLESEFLDEYKAEFEEFKDKYPINPKEEFIETHEEEFEDFKREMFCEYQAEKRLKHCGR